MAAARKPFGFTYVTYDDGDPVGAAAALLSLTPIFLIVTYAVLLVSRREAHVAFVLAGQLLNGVLNGLLKAALAQPRPAGSDRTDPGMPSDHAQFMGFFATYACAFLATRVRFPERPGWRPLLGAAVVALALAVAASRVYLGYHTCAQVGVGMGVGTLTGLAWYTLYLRHLRARLPRLVRQSRVCRYLYVLDHSAVEDVLRAEYDTFAASLPKARSR